MGKAQIAKENTVAAATRLFRRNGYHGTALQDILDEGGSPRGSLYFHFPDGKEEIGAAALAFAGERVRAAITAAAADSPNLDAFLTRMARGMAADLESTGFDEGCPIAVVAMETAGSSAVLREAARGVFQSWERELAIGMRRFDIKPGAANRIAALVLAQLEGAMLLSRTYRSTEPLKRAEAAIKLLASARAAR